MIILKYNTNTGWTVLSPYDLDIKDHIAILDKKLTKLLQNGKMELEKDLDGHFRRMKFKYQKQKIINRWGIRAEPLLVRLCDFEEKTK